MKLEPNKLMPYLPYGLKGVLVHDLREDFHSEDWIEDIEIMNKGSIWSYGGYVDEDLSIPLGEGDFSGFLVRHGNKYTSVGNSIKPLLRPLSDFEKTIAKDLMENFSCELMCIQEVWRLIQKEITLDQVSYKTYLVMCRNHIDFNGLIDQGLAIDINTFI